MPTEAYWETLFNVERALDAFRLGPGTRDVAELGCGYGTFTLPVARRIGGTVHAFDIDPVMAERTRARVAESGRTNVRVAVRDVAAEGFGLRDHACDACLLLNILHGESPVAMLQLAARVVRPGGLVAVMHWRTDVATPRGPSADIRPGPEKVAAWAAAAGGFAPVGQSILLPPWHYGLALVAGVGAGTT